ncbi:diguanylate cyclase/phosphodiesterase with PAS/PAC sensor(s) [Cytobacillus oceanisediminis]|uniref:Diguanylate cyclase/phosphodiesterase with PAS/PAC sensor(S) n=1 Tax=Cytobacillus oceanisediminis TaxID=665099 RepID=A0A2V3A2I0_9BACI|nr:EAL domain-containing protein [Cytobacillus oceanisediminis]PWW27741.1 diguanylate cyclase/phosphodiesterase with PAS/PAC sensor(s) [Cytobacillus oceanisediminis]
MAKTITCLYENTNQLNSFIDENELDEYPNLLVQVFTGIIEEEFISNLQKELAKKLPFAAIAGCSTSGEIYEGRITENQTVISFTAFKKTELKSFLLQEKDFKDSYEMGKALAQELAIFNTKALILFPAGFNVDSSSLVEGIYETNADMVIAGGIAGDNGLFQEGFAFTQEGITQNGLAAIALQNGHISARSFTNYRWQEIGKRFTVTKASGSIIYSIDHKTPLHILKNYLGEAFIKDLPKSGTEFPFLLTYRGEKVSVFIIKMLENGAIKVNRMINEGDTLTFAYANLEEIIDRSLQELKKLGKEPAESIFIYNCMARKQFARDFTEKELAMFQGIAPANGFFSYGEIASRTGDYPKIVGHSLTYLAVSESVVGSKKSSADTYIYEKPDHFKTIVSLTRLMHASQDDIENLNSSLKISEQYYKSLFNNNADFVYSTDMKGHFTSVNPAFEKTFGYNSDEILGKSALGYVRNEDIPRVRMHFYRAIRGKEQYYNVYIDSKSGETCLFQLKNIPITVNGECVGIYGIGRNITEQKKIEDKITELAYFDQDTGLPNRMKFTEQLDLLLKRAKKKRKILAVLSIDIDRFKIINDSLGHFAGDMVLKEISERIEKVLPSGSYLGRFSGDKFTLILSRDVTVDRVMKTSKKLMDEISKPLFQANQEFIVTASIGVSLYPGDGLDEHTLLKNADVATNRSKQQGGNRATFFSMEMNEQAMVRLELESYLRKALHKDEFYLCYQPLIDLESGNLYGSEALIRWNHPKLGLISPGEFIPLAEETGLIEEIGSWVLRTACKQNMRWQTLGYDSLSISVNVSAYQFQQPGFLDEVKKALELSGMEPQYLTLELTESTMLRNVEYSIQVMQALQALGVKVSIDDFGTGYSSLSYLKDLPINTLKIDRSFINNLRLNTSDIAIVKAIITMGHGLAVKVVAEGVETKEQIELLKELKCHYAQGFYIHKPLMTTEFEEGLSKKVQMYS